MNEQAAADDIRYRPDYCPTCDSDLDQDDLNVSVKPEIEVQLRHAGEFAGLPAAAWRWHCGKCGATHEGNTPPRRP